MSTSSSKWPEIIVAVIGSGLLGILLTNIISEYNLPVIEIEVAPHSSPGQNQLARYTTLITNEGNSIAENLRVTLHYLSGNITSYRIFFNGENSTSFINPTLQSALVVNVPRFSPSAVMAINTVVDSTQIPLSVGYIIGSINSKLAKINLIADRSRTNLSNVSLSLRELAEVNKLTKLNQSEPPKLNQSEKDILSNLTGAAAENELVNLTGVAELGNLNLSELAKLSNNTVYSIANRSDTKYLTPIAGPENHRGAWVVSATYDEGGVFETSRNASGIWTTC
jgi:hypothetical protein